MEPTYNSFAGQNRDRLTALSDGVFAFAMTLLVLNLAVPIAHPSEHASQLFHDLTMLLPHLIVYMLSFMTLGIFWVGQQTQLNLLQRSDRDLTWLHLAFLFAVTLMPFSTGLLAAYITLSIAVIAIGIYWGNIFLLGAMLFLSHRYAHHAELMQSSVTPAMHRAIDRRIFLAQALYAIGALLGFLNHYVSIGLILIVQLIYVIAPRIPGFDQL